MIIVMERNAAAEAVAAVVETIRGRGLREHVSHGEERTVIGAVGDERLFDAEELERLPQVERVIRVLNDWKIISRESCPDDRQIKIRGAVFGGGRLLDIAADAARAEQADAWLADPFYSGGHIYAPTDGGSEKLRLAQLRLDAARLHDAGKPVLVRIRDVRQIDAVLDAGADVLYLGGELMGNRMLADEIGRLNTPLVLCKDRHHRVADWLAAAEYIALRGNSHIILGETGTLSFDAEHPVRLDIEAVAKVRRLSSLPVIADITRLWHKDMPETLLKRLAAAAGVCGLVS